MERFVLIHPCAASNDCIEESTNKILKVKTHSKSTKSIRTAYCMFCALHSRYHMRSKPTLTYKHTNSVHSVIITKLIFINLNFVLFTPLHRILCALLLLLWLPSLLFRFSLPFFETKYYMLFYWTSPVATGRTHCQHFAKYFSSYFSSIFH